MGYTGRIAPSVYYIGNDNKRAEKPYKQEEITSERDKIEEIKRRE